MNNKVEVELEQSAEEWVEVEEVEQVAKEWVEEVEHSPDWTSPGHLHDFMTCILTTKCLWPSAQQFHGHSIVMTYETHVSKN